MRFRCCRALLMGALTDSSRIYSRTRLLNKANSKAHGNMHGSEAHQTIGLGLEDRSYEDLLQTEHCREH